MNTPPDNDEPFLARWSRRKRAETAPSEPLMEAESLAHQPGEEAPAVADPKAADEKELDLSTLPNVEELDERSDITAFLDKRVPAALRNAALGRMWTLDPTIRDFIEVAENQWNWNVPGGAPFYEPMQGGAEMAERIVQGLGSTVRSVAEAAGSTSDDTTLVEADPMHGSTDERGSDVASQSNDVDGSIEGAQYQSEYSAASVSGAHEVENAATQQSREIDDAPRRRHGGALPV